MVVFYFLGPLAGARDPVLGILLGQALLAVCALVGVVSLAQPLRTTLQLHRPSGVDLGLALLAGVSAPGVGLSVATLQADVLPVDEDALAELTAAFDVDLSLGALVLLIALTPAICEELLFRGAMLGLVRKSLPAWGQVLVVGLLFGLIHASFFRVLPTGILGLVLTWAAIRSGSLAVPVLIHFLNNALSVVSGELGWLPESGEVPLWQTVPLGLVCVVAVASMGRRSPQE
jgi:membrane protease YdiL (CAAX protease family)